MTKPATLSVPRDVAKRFVAAWHDSHADHMQILTGELVDAIETALRTEEHVMDGFDTFWSVWPNRKAKRLAQLAWAKTATDRPELHVLVAAVRANIRTDAWRKDGGQFIPLPATWLHGHRWADELVARAQVERVRTPEQLAEAQKLSDELFKRERPMLFALHKWARKFEAEHGREATRDERSEKGAEIIRQHESGVRSSGQST